MSDAAPESSAVPRFDIRAHRRPETPWYAYVGIALAITQAIFFIVVGVVAVNWAYVVDPADKSDPRWDAIFFIAGMLALGIVPAATTVGLGWAAIRDAWGHRFRHAALGAIALGAGCVYVVMWAGRMLNAVVASIWWGEYGGFASQLFWWA